MSSLEERREARAHLRKQDTMTITVTASNANLQRLRALFLYSDKPVVDVPLEPEAPFPFDELMAAPDPEPVNPPPLEIDYNAVREHIKALLAQYVERFGIDKGKAMLVSFGAERLSELADIHLIGLHQGLADQLGGVKRGSKK